MPNRDAYVAKIRGQIEDWNADIDRFQVQTRRAVADLRIECEEEVANLKGRRDALEERLRALLEAGDETWEELKGGTDKAVAGLIVAFARARSRFSVH